MRLSSTLSALVLSGLSLLLIAGCSGSGEVSRTERKSPIVCCTDGGLLPPGINTAANEYAPCVDVRGGEDLLWYTSSSVQPGRKLTALPAELLVASRAANRTMTKVQEGYGTPRGLGKIDPLFDRWTRGSATIAGNVMILAAEQPLDGARPFQREGTSYQLILWELTRDASGVFLNPTPMSAVNHPDSWTAQPALSPDGTVLLFASNRPLPGRSEDRSINIWYARKEGGAWRSPMPVAALCSPGEDISPTIDGMGNVYLSSNWNYRENRASSSGYDIYFAGSLLALLAGTAPLPRNVNEFSNALGCKDNCRFDVNTSFNEITPFVFTGPSGRVLYYASDRPESYGGYDLYACPLPAPCLRIRPLVFCFEGGNVDVGAGEVKGRPMPGEKVLVSQGGTQVEVTAGETVEVRPGIPVILTHVEVPKKCMDMTCTSVTIVPELPADDKPVDVPINCDCNPVTLETIVISDASGVPYFITGYWWPNTSRNYKEFQQKYSSGALNPSKPFINPGDYDYACASRVIDAFFEENVYKKILNAVEVVRECTEPFSLLITVVGFTDACGLRPGFYSEDDVEFRNLVIPKGHNMSWAQVREKGTGRAIALKDNGQNGNVVLSMLRAHYTMKTIDREMTARSKAYADLRAEGRIVFDLEGVGIYSEDLWRSTAPPPVTTGTRQCEKGKMKVTSSWCNSPEGRRIELYVKRIHKGDESLLARPFEADFLMPEHRDPKLPVQQCDCFRVEIPFASEEEALFTKQVIAGFGDPTAGIPELTLVEKKSGDGKTSTVLTTQCLKTKAEANALGTAVRAAAAEAARLLQKTDPSTDFDCLLYRLSFGSFYYSKNAKILAEKLEGILGQPVVIEPVFDPQQNVNVFVLYTGAYKTEAEAQRAADRFSAILKKEKISTWLTVVQKTVKK